MEGLVISNDRQAREAAGHIGDLNEALNSEHVLEATAVGLPREALESYRRSLRAERDVLSRKLAAYQKAKAGDFDLLEREAAGDFGSQLIVARIVKGYTQKDLARKLGLKEQAIQRYEAERYRSISLSGFQRFAAILGLRLTAEQSRGLTEEWGLPFEVDHSAALKVLKHARACGWIASDITSYEESLENLKRSIGEHLLRHGKPSLLRTGLGVHQRSNDLAVVAWKTQIVRNAEERVKAIRSKFSINDVRWLRPLAQMSADEAKLTFVPDMLLDHGIILSFEKGVPGMNVDGASFLIEDTPVIGMTLRKDSLDSFWFTLFHELAHVILHYWTGLQGGFYDDLDAGSLNNVEQEANSFASSCLIPHQLWITSPARIAKTPEPIQTLARELGIHPAIPFGRIRMERGDYTVFADRVGQGKVRRTLMPD